MYQICQYIEKQKDYFCLSFTNQKLYHLINDAKNLYILECKYIQISEKRQVYGYIWIVLLPELVPHKGHALRCYFNKDWKDDDDRNIDVLFYNQTKEEWMDQIKEVLKNDVENQLDFYWVI